MDKSHTDDLRSLCELASRENDSQKLLDLIRRINRALDERSQQRQTEKASIKDDTQSCRRPAGTAHTGWISTQEIIWQLLNTIARKSLTAAPDRRTSRMFLKAAA